MRLARFSLSMIAIVGVTAALMAIAMVWLFMTDPVQFADKVAPVSHGEVTPLIQALGSVLFKALQGLVKYL